MKKDKPYDRTVYQSLTMILQFGINMVVPIAMMAVLGIWLDRKLETGYFTIIGFVLGALAGGQNIYRMAKRIYGQDDRMSESTGNSKVEERRREEEQGK